MIVVGNERQQGLPVLVDFLFERGQVRCCGSLQQFVDHRPFDEEDGKLGMRTVGPRAVERQHLIVVSRQTVVDRANHFDQPIDFRLVLGLVLG